MVRQIRQEAAAGEQNLEAIIKHIIMRNGISPSLHRPTYSSHLPDFVLQTDCLGGGKFRNLPSSSGILRSPSSYTFPGIKPKLATWRIMRI